MKQDKYINQKLSLIINLPWLNNKVLWQEVLDNSLDYWVINIPSLKSLVITSLGNSLCCKIAAIHQVFIFWNHSHRSNNHYELCSNITTKDLSTTTNIPYHAVLVMVLVLLRVLHHFIFKVLVPSGFPCVGTIWCCAGLYCSHKLLVLIPQSLVTTIHGISNMHQIARHD